MLIDLDEDQVTFLRVLGNINEDLNAGRPTKAPDGWDEPKARECLSRLLTKLNAAASSKRHVMVEEYARARAASAEQDAEDCTNYAEELQLMARQLAERMTVEELEAFLEGQKE